MRGLGFSFWAPPLPVVVGVLTGGDPAERAGIALGDRIIAVEGQPITDYAEFVATIRARPGMSHRADGGTWRYAAVLHAGAENHRRGRAHHRPDRTGRRRLRGSGIPRIDADGRTPWPVRCICAGNSRDLGQERPDGALPVAHGHRPRLDQEHLRPDQHCPVRRADGERGLQLLSRLPGAGLDLAREC